jgi:hypothetical protein
MYALYRFVYNVISSSLLGDISIMTQQLSKNVFDFRYTGINDSYGTVITAFGNHLWKIFLY